MKLYCIQSISNCFRLQLQTGSRMTKRKKIGYRRKYTKKSYRTSSTTVNKTHSQLGEIEHYDSDSFFANFFLQKETCYDETDCHMEVDANEFIDSDGYSADEFYVILNEVYKYHPQQNLDEIVSCVHNKIFSELKSKCKAIGNDQFFWVPCSEDIKFISIYDSDGVSVSPRIKSCIRVTKNIKVEIFVHSKRLPGHHPIWSSIKENCYSVLQLENVVREVSSYSVCYGNRDADLQSLNIDNTLAYKEQYYIGPTIYSVSCCMLIKQRSERCKNCKTYRKALMKKKLRNAASVPTSEKDWLQSRTSNNNLSENEKSHKLKQLKYHSRKLEQEVRRLKSVIAAGRHQNIQQNENVTSVILCKLKKLKKDIQK